MSGGYFDYQQYTLERIADDIERVVANNNIKDDFGYSHDYSHETLVKFEIAISALRNVANMAQRIDWLLSDDDGEESFHKRWKEDVV